MIAKMKFVSLSGPKADIDRMVNKYLTKYETDSARGGSAPCALCAEESV